MTSWPPHITVATVIKQDSHFLIVEEFKGGRGVLNQPAGHLEPNESLTEAAIRETLEETGYDVELTGVVGIYLYTAPSNGVTYQRICFAGKALKHHPERALDEGIMGALWLTREQIIEQQHRWRSELLLRCVDDFLQGPLHNLSLIRER